MRCGSSFSTVTAHSGFLSRRARMWFVRFLERRTAARAVVVFLVVLLLLYSPLCNPDATGRSASRRCPFLCLFGLFSCFIFVVVVVVVHSSLPVCFFFAVLQATQPTGLRSRFTHCPRWFHEETEETTDTGPSDIARVSVCVGVCSRQYSRVRAWVASATRREASLFAELPSL